MDRKQLAQAVEQAIGAHTQGKAPSVMAYKARTDTKGKPAGAYVASVKAVKRVDREQAQAGHDAYESTGYAWAQKDNALNETRKAEAFAFAGASTEELALVKQGVKRFYSEMKDSLRSEGSMSGDKGEAHVGAAKQFRTIDSRQDEKICILDGFAALYDMARMGDDWEREAGEACFEQLATLGWNQLVAACRTLRSVHKQNGLTVDEAKKISEHKRAVKKQEAKVKPVSTEQLVNDAKAIAVALAQRGNVKGIDVSMMLRALGATHDAGVTEIKRAAPAKQEQTDLRDRIKARLDARAPQGAMAKAIAKAA